MSSGLCINCQRFDAIELCHICYGADILEQPTYNAMINGTVIDRNKPIKTSVSVAAKKRHKHGQLKPIGNKLFCYRKRARLSRTKLSVLCGVSPWAIADFEKGKRELPLKHKKNLAVILKFDFRMLIRRKVRADEQYL